MEIVAHPRHDDCIDRLSERARLAVAEFTGQSVALRRSLGTLGSALDRIAGVMPTSQFAEIARQVQRLADDERLWLSVARQLSTHLESRLPAKIHGELSIANAHK